MSTKKFKFGSKEFKLNEKLTIAQTKVLTSIQLRAKIEFEKIKKDIPDISEDAEQELRGEMLIEQFFNNICDIMPKLFPNQDADKIDWENEEADKILEVLNSFLSAVPVANG